MADFVTQSGREITFDLSQITVGEYRSLFDPKQAVTLDDSVLEKALGVEAGFILGLSLIEHKKLFREFIKRATSPLSDPN